MESKKILKINCAVCDVRNVTEELLSTYETVRANCGVVITNPAAQALLGRYGVSINCASTLILEEGVVFSTVNGAMELYPGQVPEGKTALMVNGTLDIAPGCEDVLKGYVSITVNGNVKCPRSMVPLLSNVNVNGSTSAYPDGCVRLGSDVVLDRTFPLRARQDALYYAEDKVVALAPDVDFDKLVAKNVRFAAGTLLVSESQAEAAAPLFDEETEIVILPDGCAYVDGKAALDESLVKRYGGKLFIDGTLTVDRDSGPALDQIEFLRVDGNIRAARSMRDRVAAVDAVYDRLVVVADRTIGDKTKLTVTRELLERVDGMLGIEDCLSVTFREDVTPELIGEKLLRISDCTKVICTETQLAVLELLAEDVLSMGPQSEEEDEEEDGPEDGNVVKINCAAYTF